MHTPEDPELRHAWVILRRIIMRLAQLFLLARADDDEDAREISWYRADGRCACRTCGMPYWRHVDDPIARWLVVLCDGSRVKL